MNLSDYITEINNNTELTLNSDSICNCLQNYDYYRKN